MACRDPELARLVEGYDLGLLSDGERERLEEHALGCDGCFEGLYGEGLVTNLLTGEEEERVPRVGRGRIVLLVGAIAASLVLAVLWLGIPQWETGRTRGPEAPAIQILAPEGEVARPAELRWEPVAGARAYRVRIYTDRGLPIWETEVEAPPAVIPEEVREALEAGQVYFWDLAALGPEGTLAESRLIRFTVRE
jgi:hypothetical protein